MKNLLIKFCSALVVILAVAACDRSNLVPLTQTPAQIQQQSFRTGTADVRFCTTPPLTVKEQLKLIFVIDKSGSNELIYDFSNGSSRVGTDPDKERRYTPLLTFLDGSNAASDTSYALITFSTDPSIKSGFTQDRTAFRSSVVKSRAEKDEGATDYLKALGKVRELIEADVVAASKANPVISSQYIVFWISDGRPVVFETEQNPADILKEVKSLRSLITANPTVISGMRLHTGYYFNNADRDPRAEQLMIDMAAQGAGDAYQFSEGQAIDFSRFSLPILNLRYQVKDVFVENANSVWENGQLLLDSDGDGLSDEFERTLGSSPVRADSDFNGISDFVEYTVYGKPCNDSKCGPSFAVRPDVCEAMRKAGSVPFLDSDRDGLNDCEETLILSNKQDPDSNSAWVPDFLALRAGYGFNAGKIGLLLDPDLDGLNNYGELKSQLPIEYDNDLLSSVQPYSYRLQTLSASGNQTCYQLTVKDIPITSYQNRIRVSLFEMPQIVSTKKIFRTATLPMNSNGVAVFTEGDLR